MATRRFFATCCLTCFLPALVAIRPAAGQEELKNPFAGDPAAAQQGKSLFRSACASCHGIDARGGGRGPDLTDDRSIHGDSDGALFKTVSQGVPSTEMQPSGLREEEIWVVIAYLRSLAGNTGPPPSGDRAAGERLFFSSGVCSQCHMVKGRGGRLGPDLSRIGASRPTRYLVEAVREPGKEIPAQYETVQVVTRDGAHILGVRKNEDTFSIQLMDQEEQLHLLLKKELHEVIYEKKSLMPDYPVSILSDKDLKDLLAYLDSLRG